MKIKIEASHLQNLKDDLERAEVMNEDLSERLERAEAEIEYLKGHVLAFAEEAEFQCRVAHKIAGWAELNGHRFGMCGWCPSPFKKSECRHGVSGCRLLLARTLVEEEMK